MKETLLLTKILLKNSFNKNLQKEKKGTSKIGMSILLGLVVIYIFGILGYASYEIVEALKSINQEQIFLTLCIVISIGVTLFKTIFTALNVLYFSKDVEFLLPLPLKSINIVLAKFNVMLFSEYITEIITFVVPFAIYGYVMKTGIAFFVLSLLVFLFLPIIPMLISITLIVLVMRFTKFLNNKDIVQYLSVALTMLLVIGVQFLNTSSNEVTQFMITNKMLEINGLASIFSKYFFTAQQATTLLTSTEIVEVIKNLVCLGLESICAYILVGFAVSKVYLKTAIYATVSSYKKTKSKIKKFTKKNIGKSYVKKEIKILFRNPVFFLQCVLPTIILPIVFSIPIYRTITAQAQTTELFKESIQVCCENSMGVGIILCIINFLYLLNFISVTAISRDGENAIFMKYIPVQLHTQCKYKVIPSIILNFIPLTYIVGIIKYLSPEVMWITLFEIFIMGLILNILISYIMIFIDLLKPKIHWTSEYSVVKQNMNMLYDAICIIAIMGIIIAICAYVENIHLLAGIIIALSSFTLIVYEKLLKKFSRQIFKKIA